MLKIAILTNAEYWTNAILKLNKIYTVFVITHKKKPQGRGLKVPPNKIVELCNKNGIQVWEVENINREPDKLYDFSPDIIVICDFKDILKEEIINIAKVATINIHPSLLPSHRGASPIQSAILNNDSFTGYSIIEIAPHIDTGKIYYQKVIPIYEWDNFFTLQKRIFDDIENNIIDIINDIVDKKITPFIQDEEKATMCRKFAKQDGIISWNEPAFSIYKKVLAFSKWPGVYFFNNKNKQISIISANIIDENSNMPPGSIININTFGIWIQTSVKILHLIKVKPENKKIMSAFDYANGDKLKIGSFI